MHLEDRIVPAALFPEFLDPNPAAGNQFGHSVVPLSNGNVVITSPFDDAGGTNAGAVYLFNGTNGNLISTLVGGSDGDRIGLGGITVLNGDNFLILSPNWSNGSNIDAGAVTWVSGALGLTGTVGSANSLVGVGFEDRLGSTQPILLNNGNYVVVNPDSDVGAHVDAGSVTLGDPFAGVTGVISAANSLVGSRDSDLVGSGGVTQLIGGNHFVVASPLWNGDTTTNVGAVTFIHGTNGLVGEVSALNSLVGEHDFDQVGEGGVTALPSGNYLVISPNWNTDVAEAVGAVTFGNGGTGVQGLITDVNSLIGSHDFDTVGSGGVLVLDNGHYVVVSPQWANDDQANAGAVTFGDGVNGAVGLITDINSLVGSATGDRVGSNGVAALSSGSYVVRSPEWNGELGAVTFADGSTGIVGEIAVGNSLIGATAGDRIGSGAVIELTDGDYVVHSPLFSNDAISGAGAITRGNGDSGIVGVVSSTNSVVGATEGEQVGSVAVTPLANGAFVLHSPGWDFGRGAMAFVPASGMTGTLTAANSLVGTTIGDLAGTASVVVLDSTGHYLVVAPSWDNDTAVDAGAVAFGTNSAGVVGEISDANSLVGTSTGDGLAMSVTRLPQGDYVVVRPNWNDDLVENVGAVTVGDGVAGTVGVVSSTNSLVGTLTNDRVGLGGVTVLENGNFVVVSYDWSNGGAARAGAVTFGDANLALVGPVSAANSLVGSTADDQVGFPGVTALSNGHYVVVSSFWDDGSVVDVGAVTWGDGSTGVSGPVTALNSLIGSTNFDALGSGGVVPLNSSSYAVISPARQNGVDENAGAVTFASATAPIVGVIDDENSALGEAADSGLSENIVVNSFTLNFYSRFLDEDGGRVRVGSTFSGFFPDSTPPDVQIDPPSLAIANAGSTVQIVILFSDVSGVILQAEPGHFTLETTGDANADIAFVEFGDTITVTLSNFTGNGDIRLLVAAGAAVDGAGNPALAAGPSDPILVDTNDPQIDVDLVGLVGDNGWYQSAVEITINATDDGSGIDGVSYSFDNIDFLPYTVPFEVTSDGEYELFVGVLDAAENETTQIFPILIDATAPTFVPHLDGDEIGNNWFSSSVDVTLNATDATSGVASVTYTINAGAPIAYDGPFTIADDGITTIAVTITDVAGNIFTQSFDVKINTTGAVVNGSFSGAPGANDWFTSAGDFTINVTDTVNDIDTIEYVLNADAPAIYLDPFPIASEGINTITVTATDVLGLENFGVFTVNIDTVDPNFTSDVQGTLGLNDWYTSSVEIILNATDATSGIASVVYAINGGAPIAYDDPFTISVDGVHVVSVMVTDVAGNTFTDSFTVQVDAAGPTVTGTFDGDAGDDDWFTSTGDFTIAASDANSGIDSVFYVLNGGASTEYTAPFAITGEGTHTIVVTATDLAGNVTVETFTVEIDSIDPTFTSDVQGTLALNDWYTSNVEITLNATDATSGVASVVYTINGGAPIAYDDPFTISANGVHVVSVMVTDVAGNSFTDSFTFSIDAAGPTVTGTFDGDAGDDDWFTSTGDFTIAAADPNSGIDSVFYVLNGAASTEYTVPFEITGEGTHTIVVTATDLAGNVTVETFTVEVDSIDPTFTSDVQGTLGLNDWYTSNVEITLNATDATSGVASVVYTINAGTPIAYDDPFTISANGIHVVAVTVTDVAGNSFTDSFTVQVDAAGPTVTGTFDGDAGENDWFTSTGNFTIAASDANSGIDSVFYVLNGGASTEYTAPFEITGEGTHTIVVTATDLAGNVTVETFTVQIDTIAPAVVIGAPSPATATAGGSASFVVTFTDPNFDLATLTADDVNVITTGTASAVVSISGSGNTRTVTLSSIVGNGTLAIAIDAGVARDLAGNLSLASATSAALVVDSPTGDVTITGPLASNTIVLFATPGGDTGDITYILNGGAPIPLFGVTSFHFDGNTGDDSLTVTIPASGRLVAGAISFDGKQASDTLIVDAAGQLGYVQINQLTAGEQVVAFVSVEDVQLRNASLVNGMIPPDLSLRDTAFDGLSPDQRFVQALFLANLGRAGTMTELNDWVDRMLSTGASRSSIAAEIATSREANQRLVQTWYQAYLGRTIEGNEADGWINALATQSEESVLAGILASSEYVARAVSRVDTGSDDERFVAALYLDFLGRSAGAGEISEWTGQIATLGRGGVAEAILRSPEYLANLVQSYYVTTLRRPGEASGYTYWINQGDSSRDTRLGFQESDEFYVNG